MLSGASHAAAVTDHQPTVAAATAKETALLPPTLLESYFQKSGDTVTGLVMVFSKQLDPTTAQNVNNYQILREVRNSTVELSSLISASAAAYNPSQDSVTLILAHPFKPSPAQRGAACSVSVTPGSTITDTTGNVLIHGSYNYPSSDSSSGLADFVAQGPSPNPMFHTYNQSRINTLLSKHATPEAIAAAAASYRHEAAWAAANAAANAADDAAHAAAAAAFAAGPKIHLTGTIQGTYSPKPQYYIVNGPVEYLATKMNGSGSISPVGQVTENIIEAPWDTQRLYGSLHTNQGSFYEHADLHRVSTRRLEGTYTIAGVYSGASDSGQGHLVITWTGDASRGKFTEFYS